MKLLHKNEVYKIIGAAMEVYRELGPGFLEAVYHEALEIEFDIRGIPYESKKKLRIQYKGCRLKKGYESDFFCYGIIPVEIKASKGLIGGDAAQLINYLKATELEIGLLINFGTLSELEWRRLIFSSDRFKYKNDPPNTASANDNVTAEELLSAK